MSAVAISPIGSVTDGHIRVLQFGLRLILAEINLFVKMTAQGSPAKMKELRLPMSRVKTIMKSSPYVDTIGQDGLYLVTKATVRFTLEQRG